MQNAGRYLIKPRGNNQNTKHNLQNTNYGLLFGMWIAIWPDVGIYTNLAQTLAYKGFAARQGLLV
jgi:hypothetical protein